VDTLLYILKQYVSIHAPREGSDFRTVILLAFPACVSIHAPREGSDHGPTCKRGRSIRGFNPRSP